MTKLEDIKTQYTEIKAKNSLLSEQISQNDEECVETAETLDLGVESLAFLERVAISRRNSVKDKVEDIISEALQVIYGSTYSVELGYRVKNNRSYMEIELIKKTKIGEIRRDMSGFGGGVSDTISVPLRLLVLLGSAHTDNVCILDEAWKHMDNFRIEYVADFLKEIATKLGIQIIMSTHHEVIREKANNVFDITYLDGRSNIERKKL